MRLAKILNFYNYPARNYQVNDVATIKGFEVIFNNVVTFALGIAGIVFFIMLIVGGFRYIFAGGDPKSAAAARNVITYAIIGLLVLIISYLALLLIEFFTGAQITTFNLTA